MMRLSLSSRHRVIFMPTTQVARIIAEHSPALNGKPGVKRALHESLLLYPMIHALASNPLTLSSKMLQDFVLEHLVRSFSQTMRVKWSHKLRLARRCVRNQMEPSRKQHKHRSQGGDHFERGSHATRILLGASTKPSGYRSHVKHFLKLYDRCYMVTQHLHIRSAALAVHGARHSHLPRPLLHSFQSSSPSKVLQLDTSANVPEPRS